MAVLGINALYKNLPEESLLPEETGHFNIFKIEDLLVPNSKQAAYSRRSFYKISLVTGHSKIHYADQCVEVNGSALVFTNPLVPYFWERISEKQSGCLCLFTEDFFSRFANIKEFPVFQSADTAIVPLNDEESKFFTDLFHRMQKELNGEYAYKYDLLRNLLMELVHEAQKMHPAAGTKIRASNAAERIASLFLELLERQFPIELSQQSVRLHAASAFAGQLHVHVNHLNKALKEITGKTTSQLINDRILQEAKILLKSTSWSIAEISWCLGFAEANHFSSFFKARTKTAPLKFRQN
ncbi:AraC family transcriptional regulator [uncultured Flavobacterium sp.]|uniref:helix-turn-helix domain-containing protein n=1 Tax=uncultured Flavobacterium sp. TaxID=165435 RepID=UPI0025EAC979|nr:AraC family transcriptional regulator [uncultured Flavobacterium sp.]